MNWYLVLMQLSVFRGVLKVIWDHNSVQYIIHFALPFVEKTCATFSTDPMQRYSSTWGEWGGGGPFVRSDEGLTLETAALGTLYGYQFTVLTQLKYPSLP